jgi:hypothetical protein
MWTKMINRAAFVMVASLMLVVLALPVGAQGNRIILDNNSGVSSSLWRITGEPTLVMNGFDLTPTSLRLPVVIENINIDVFQYDPNALVTAVVYQDPNGGSPVDAELVASTQVKFTRQGVNTFEFPSPVVVNTPIVWLGFYMPEEFQFRADRQGASVLTYWAWTPDNRFDLRDLSSAQVFGPSDGTAPVNIALGGVARIRGEAVTANTETIEAVYANEQVTVPLNQLDYLRNYSGCPTLFKDESDVIVTYGNQVSVQCREVPSWHSPLVPVGYTRRSNARNVVYDITVFNDEGEVLTGPLQYPITHCVTPALNEQESAIVGVAYGSPRRWEFLPSDRFGNLVCAEIPRGGSISYFTPD